MEAVLDVSSWAARRWNGGRGLSPTTAFRLRQTRLLERSPFRGLVVFVINGNIYLF
jgi:hypothetical protein